MNLANRSIMIMGAPPYKKLDTVAAATAFSELSTYDVGDVVSYKARIYKCSSAVSSSGAWTGTSNWEEIILAEELINLTEELSKKVDRDVIFGMIADDMSTSATYDSGSLAISGDTLYGSIDGTPSMDDALTSFNIVTDLELNVDSPSADVLAAILSKFNDVSIQPVTGDYCYVEIPSSSTKLDDIVEVDRYVFDTIPQGHNILMVTHGNRPIDSIAFDEGQDPVVVSVSHGSGETYLLREQNPKVWITVDFMDGSRHKVGTLDGLYDITVAENTITFKMTDNTTELIDGDWWNRDVTLYIAWADGTVSEKTLRFLQM